MKKTTNKEKGEQSLEGMFTKQPALVDLEDQGQELDWTGKLEKKKKVARFITYLLNSGHHLNQEAFYTTARMSNRTFVRIINSDNQQEVPTENAFNRVAITVLCLIPDLCRYLSKQRLLSDGSFPHGVVKLSPQEEDWLRKDYIDTFGSYGEYFVNKTQHYEELTDVLEFLFRKVDTRNRKSKKNTDHHHSELS